jgi:hypothetical protein
LPETPIAVDAVDDRPGLQSSSRSTKVVQETDATWSSPDVLLRCSVPLCSAPLCSGPLIVVTLVSLAGMTPAAGQAAGVPVGANQNVVTEFKGKLKGFQRGILTFVRDDGTEVLVQPPEDAAAFQFVAAAKLGFLQRGALVRFTGTFNQAGISLEPIAKIELFQPITGKVAGHLRESFLPGVYPEVPPDPQQPPPQTARFRVVGGLMGIDGNGVMLVQAGRQPIRVQLAEDPEFQIRYNNLILAQEGDPVTISGFYEPPDETKVRGDRVTVTTDRVYGDPDSETAARPTRKRSRRADADNKGAAESPAVGESKPESPQAK